MIRPFTSALFVFILFAGCASPGIAPREPTPGMPQLVVATYNVHDKMSGDEATVAAVGATGADVICLIESSDAWRVVLEARYRDEYPYMAFDGRSSAGIGVMSRYPFAPGTLLEGINEGHPAWSTVVDTPLGAVRVLLVHLRAPVNNRDGATANLLRIDEIHLKEMRSFVGAFDDATTPWIVLGDFNESPDGAAVEFLEHRGFVNTLPLFNPGQETWRYGKSLAGQHVETIDHILLDERFRPLYAYALNKGNSDHVPVVVHFEPQSQ